MEIWFDIQRGSFIYHKSLKTQICQDANSVNTFWLLATLAVVKMTTSYAASYDKYV